MDDNARPISPADARMDGDTQTHSINVEGNFSHLQSPENTTAQEPEQQRSMNDNTERIEPPSAHLQKSSEQWVAPDGIPLSSSAPYLQGNEITLDTSDAVNMVGSQNYQSIAALASEMDASSYIAGKKDNEVYDDGYYDNAASSSYSQSKERIIKAFAMLKFEDAIYYMQTYTVILGRDEDALNEMRLRHQHGFLYDASSGPGSVHSARASDAGVSIVGGILGCAPAVENNSQAPISAGSASDSASHGGSMARGPIQNDIASVGTREETEDAMLRRAPNPFKHELNPDECPLITIHPPVMTMDPYGRTSNISRRHAKIAYNPKDGLFKITVLGRNGLFINDKHHGVNEEVELRSHDSLQIGGVRFDIYLARGETGVEDAMSLDFEDERGEEGVAVIDTSGTTETTPDHLFEEYSSQGELEEASSNEDDEDDEEINEDEDEEEDEEDDSDEANSEGSERLLGEKQAAQKFARARKHKKNQTKLPKVTLKVKPQAKDTKKKAKSSYVQEPEPRTDVTMEPNAEIPGLPGIPAHLIPPRRKGPGRPPKNGIMSKREQAQIIRQQKELAKAEGIKNGTIKPGKPRQGELGDFIPEKRKYTKRKKTGDQADNSMEVHESIEGGDEGQDMDLQSSKPKEKRPPKPPRSPSPVFDEATLTPEQLAKPAQSYVVLIHEALSNSPSGQMSLPQIYRAIERRYPYYKLRVTTQGWQSSVRHNLSQHNAFCKIEREGKGWMWGLVPDVTIDKEKKKRPSPPTMPAPSYYPQPSPIYRQPPPYTYPGIPSAQSGQPPPPIGQHPYMYHPPPPGHGYPPGPPGMPRAFNGIPLPFAGAQNGSNTYQSPYTSSTTSFGLQQGPQQAQTTSNQQGQSQAPPDSLNINAAHSVSSSIPPSNQPMQSSTDSALGKPLPPTAFHHANLPQHILDAVDRYKAAIMKALVEWPNIEDTVTRAINRTLCIHPIPDPLTPKGPQEETFEKELKVLLGSMLEKHRQAEERRRAMPQSTVSNQMPKAVTENIDHPTDGAQQTSEVHRPVDDSAAAGTPPTNQEVSGSASDPKSQINPSSPRAPLQEHQQTQILSLLQQLGHNPTSDTQTTPGPTVTTPTEQEGGKETPPLANSKSAERAQAHAISASREAADKVINALGAGSKRVHVEAGEDSDDSSQAEISKLVAQFQGDQPRIKRVAV